MSVVRKKITGTAINTRYKHKVLQDTRFAFLVNNLTTTYISSCTLTGRKKQTNKITGLNRHFIRSFKKVSLLSDFYQKTW